MTVSTSYITFENAYQFRTTFVANLPSYVLRNKLHLWEIRAMYTKLHA